MYMVTGASGHLGRLIIEALLRSGIAADDIVGMARTPAKATALNNLGITIRQGDYVDKASLSAALQGVKRVVLVSSSEVGQRTVQHQNVIDVAKQSGVELLVYTSLLHANSSPLALADEHKQTEEALVTSGIPHIILRNGWYLENYTEHAATAVQHGAVIGAAGQGQVSAASRADYAEAAALVVASNDTVNRVYELAGDAAFTMQEYAEVLSEVSGQPVSYQDMPTSEYEKVLIDLGVPQGFAAVLADSDAGLRVGGLYNDSQSLSKLLGRPTTSIEEALRLAL